MKNSSEIYICYAKTDSFTLFPEIWNFFSNFKKVYFDEKSPLGVLWVSEAKWERFEQRDIEIKSKTLFLLGKKENRDFILKKLKENKNSFTEVNIKYQLPYGNLKGRFFVVVRPMPDALYFANKLEKFGAKAVPFPVLKFKITKPPDLEKNLKKNWDFIIFTSKRGVMAFESLIKNKKELYEFLRNKKIISIGPETRKEVLKLGFDSILPEEYTQEGIVEFFKKNIKGSKKTLILRTYGREYLFETLKRLGFNVKEIKIYDMVPEQRKRLGIFYSSLHQADEFIFTSPKLFDTFLKIIGKQGKNLLKNKKIISIGRVTKEHISKKGFDVFLMPEKFTGDEIIKTLLCIKNS